MIIGLFVNYVLIIAILPCNHDKQRRDNLHLDIKCFLNISIKKKPISEFSECLENILEICSLCLETEFFQCLRKLFWNMSVSNLRILNYDKYISFVGNNISLYPDR